MANSNHDSSQNNGDHKKFDAKRRKIEPPRTAPDTERGLTHSLYFNGPLYQRMSEDLHLGGLSKRTYEGYLRAVRQLADFCKCPPDLISEDQLRKFFLHLKNDREFASGWLRVAFSCVKFFCVSGRRAQSSRRVASERTIAGEDSDVCHSRAGSDQADHDEDRLRQEDFDAHFAALLRDASAGGAIAPVLSLQCHFCRLLDSKVSQFRREQPHSIGATGCMP